MDTRPTSASAASNAATAVRIVAMPIWAANTSCWSGPRLATAFEQHTLKAFLQGGYHERHLNRMRNLYRTRRDTLLAGLAGLGNRLQVRGQEAGAHLLLQIPGLTEEAMLKSAGGEGRAGLSAIGVLQQRPQRDAHSGCRLWRPERKRAARDGRLVGCGLAVG